MDAAIKELKERPLQESSLLGLIENLKSAYDKKRGLSADELMTSYTSDSETLCNLLTLTAPWIDPDKVRKISAIDLF